MTNRKEVGTVLRVQDVKPIPQADGCHDQGDGLQHQRFAKRLGDRWLDRQHVAVVNLHLDQCPSGLPDTPRGFLRNLPPCGPGHGAA